MSWPTTQTWFEWEKKVSFRASRVVTASSAGGVRRFLLNQLLYLLMQQNLKLLFDSMWFILYFMPWRQRQWRDDRKWRETKQKSAAGFEHVTLQLHDVRRLQSLYFKHSRKSSKWTLSFYQTTISKVRNETSGSFMSSDSFKSSFDWSVYKLLIKLFVQSYIYWWQTFIIQLLTE